MNLTFCIEKLSARAATAETRVNYQYEDQTPDNTELVEKYSTPVDKDTKKSFKEKNLKNGRITVDEENDVVTMIYYGLDGKERQSQITGLPLGMESYFINGSLATKGAADIALEKDPDAVLLSAYLKNGNTVRAVISADYGKFVTGTIDCSKPINTLVIKEGDELIQNREPQFQGGGMPEFAKWVHDHIKYPEGVISEGRVDVSFTVSKDGGVTDIKILRGADAKLNEEAIRVVESSGNGWVPAIKDGKKISITMLIPIIFKK